MGEQAKLYKDADSRLKGYFGHVSHPTMQAGRTYCIFCGKPWGYCSNDSSEFVSPHQVIVTCDDCDMIMLQFNGQTVPQHMLDAFGLIPEPAGEIKGESQCTGLIP